MRKQKLEEVIEENLKPAEVAQLLDVSIGTVWRWMNRPIAGRQLAWVHVGGRRRVLLSELRQFLAPPLRAGGLAALPKNVESKLDALLKSHSATRSSESTK